MISSYNPTAPTTHTFDQSFLFFLSTKPVPVTSLLMSDTSSRARACHQQEQEQGQGHEDDATTSGSREGRPIDPLNAVLLGMRRILAPSAHELRFRPQTPAVDEKQTKPSKAVTPTTPPDGRR